MPPLASADAKLLTPRLALMTPTATGLKSASSGTITVYYRVSGVPIEKNTLQRKRS